MSSRHSNLQRILLDKYADMYNMPVYLDGKKVTSILINRNVLFDELQQQLYTTLDDLQYRYRFDQSVIIFTNFDTRILYVEYYDIEGSYGYITSTHLNVIPKDIRDIRIITSPSVYDELGTQFFSLLNLKNRDIAQYLYTRNTFINTLARHLQSLNL